MMQHSLILTAIVGDLHQQNLTISKSPKMSIGDTESVIHLKTTMRVAQAIQERVITIPEITCRLPRNNFLTILTIDRRLGIHDFESRNTLRNKEQLRKTDIFMTIKYDVSQLTMKITSD